MNKELLDKIIELKSSYALDGFLIEGVFGSFVRNENSDSSDIDILYDLNGEFRSNYKGYQAVARLDFIQRDISQTLKIRADLVQKSTLGKVGKKYILPEVHYV